jgi:hypothetical protein
VRLTEQDDIDIAGGLLAAQLQRCGAEDLFPVEAARVVAEDRQRIAGDELPDGREIHLLALDVARGGVVALDAPLVVEQVHLDARIHHHQLTE